MKQFDVCRLRERSEQLVVVLQHDMADELTTRVVAPLSDKPYHNLIARVRVPVQFDGGPCVVQLDRMSAIGLRSIGGVVGSLIAEEYRIKSALDLLFFGI